MGIDISRFHQTFFDESGEGLDVMESALLALDVDAGGSEAIHTIFRAAHSIKGGAATFGFPEIASFTHNVETLLDEMRAGARPVTQPAVDLLLQSVDCLRAMLVAARGGAAADPAPIAAVQGGLQALLAEPASDTAAHPASAPVDAGATKGGGYTIRFQPLPHILRTGNDPLWIMRELEALGTLDVGLDATALPALAALDPEDCYLAWTIRVATDAPAAKVAEIFDWVEQDCTLTIEPWPGTEAASSAPPMPDAEPAALRAAPAVAKEPANKRAEVTSGDAGSIRVAIDKVDALINMVGGLVITQSMLSQLGQDFDMTRVEQLQAGLQQLQRHTRELQESVMRIRMLPISVAFSRLPRLVRDLGQKLNKKVDLRLVGEQTELDKTVLERIGDPLVHLVRNALDHGLETPATRLAAGKPETGHLRVEAFHKGGNIIIQISDDGAGIDTEAVLAKARANGLVAADQRPGDEEIWNLIFEPGFSTAKEVSDVSGRGVGMDVVRRNVQAMGGSVEVHSQSGQGATFTIRLPLTLAILDGQLVRVGDQTFVIPLVSIVESVETKPEFAYTIAGQTEVYKLRNEYLPVVRLYRAFGIATEITELTQGLLVVVEGDGVRAGVLVDELLAQQQVVIKSLEQNFRKVPGVSGATILGDGTVALIVDVAGLLTMAHGRRSRAEWTAALASADTATPVAAAAA